MKSGDLIVKSHKPVQRKAIMVGAVVGVVVALAGVYELGVYQGGHSRTEAATQLEQRDSDIAQLQLDKKGLQEQITTLNRTQAIDGKAYEEVRNNLKQLQEEILELRQEVEFYRGIVSPKERLAGLSIQSFAMEPAGEEGLFHYELVLTQVLKNDKLVKGVVNVFVDGVQDGEPKRLQFKNLTPNNSVKRDFRFRYFQRLEGDVQMPEGFTPRDVVVEMSPKGRKKISESFPWYLPGA